MAERTISQVVNEIEQTRKKILDAEATIQAQRPKVTELVREMTAMQSETLGHFGMRLVLENARDGLPEVPAEPRRRGPKPGTTRKPRSEQRSDQDAVREWAQRTNWVNPKTSKPLSARGPVPLQAYEDYDRSVHQTEPTATDQQQAQEGETQENQETPHALPPEPPRRTRRK